ncbi:MAG: hypothetical protein IKP46_08280 [Bacteroidales bacterium]|nr:hypothetical protein [Bacteroidales bacterium]
MKTRILLLALAVLSLGFFATSCNKADFLEGTKWRHTFVEDVQSYAAGSSIELIFSSKSRFYMLALSEDDEPYEGYDGKYSGKKNLVYLDFGSGDGLIGVIDGNQMKIDFLGKEITLKKKSK